MGWIPPVDPAGKGSCPCQENTRIIASSYICLQKSNMLVVPKVGCTQVVTLQLKSWPSMVDALLLPAPQNAPLQWNEDNIVQWWKQLEGKVFSIFFCRDNYLDPFNFSDSHHNWTFKSHIEFCVLLHFLFIFHFFFFFFTAFYPVFVPPIWHFHNICPCFFLKGHYNISWTN